MSHPHHPHHHLPAPGDTAAFFASMIRDLASEAEEEGLSPVAIVLEATAIAMEAGETTQLCRHVGDYLRGYTARKRRMIESN